MIVDPSTFAVGDPRPDAPELAPRGPYGVGVRTLTLSDPVRLDLAAAAAGASDPRSERRLTVELFYPTDGGSPPIRYSDRFAWWKLAQGKPQGISFSGRAARDAETAAGPFPLVQLSHGYLGSRYTLSNLAENLASKGYVVAAPGHGDDAPNEPLRFPSVLLNRPLDQLFVFEAVAALAEERGPLAGRIDPDRRALIGYSMGGYAALNLGGAGLSEAFLARSQLPPGALGRRAAGRVEADPRLKAIVALAPWGGPAALAASGIDDLACWEPEGLAALSVPTLFVAGSDDDVSGYDGGVRWLFEHATSAERALLTYRHARHNVGPNPPPPESWSDAESFERYAEPVWSAERINNVNQHFVTAFLAAHVLGDDRRTYLTGPAMGSWVGFGERSAVGLEVEVASGRTV